MTVWSDKVLCLLFGHAWHDGPDDRFGHQSCRRCDAIRILFEDPSPDIGKPKYFWQEFQP